MMTEWRRRLVLWLLVLLLFLPLWYNKGCSLNPSGETTAFLHEKDGVVVMVKGSVAHPGVYKFCDAPSVETVIKMAGGPRPLPDEGRELMQKRVSGGDVINITGCDGLNSLKTERMKTVELIALGLPLSINDMTREDWEKLPSIGPALAAEIERYRQIHGGFATYKELEKVSGIGKRKMETLEAYFLTR